MVKNSFLFHYKYLFFLNRNYLFYTDLSNDSYSTVNMGLEDGASPHSGRGSYVHGSSSPPPYLSSRHSPTPMGQNMSYSSYPDNIVYTSIGIKSKKTKNKF